MTTSDARKRLAAFNDPHAGCIRGLCRAGNHHSAVRCDEPVDGAARGGAPSAEAAEEVLGEMCRDGYALEDIPEAVRRLAAAGCLRTRADEDWEAVNERADFLAAQVRTLTQERADLRFAARSQRPEAVACTFTGCERKTAFPRCSFHTATDFYSDEDDPAQRPEGVTVTEVCAYSAAGLPSCLAGVRGERWWCGFCRSAQHAESAPVAEWGVFRLDTGEQVGIGTTENRSSAVEALRAWRSDGFSVVLRTRPIGEWAEVSGDTGAGDLR